MNTSSAPEIWWSSGHYIIISIKFCLSVFIITNNLLLLLTILYHKLLRKKKENLVIFSVALVDWLFGCQQAIFALYHLWILKTGWAAHPVHHQQCLRTLWGILAPAIYLLTCQALVLAMQSIDRLMAITKPLFYFGLTTSYVWRSLAVILAYGMVQTMILLVYSLDPEDQRVSFRAFCIPQRALGPQAFKLWSTQHVGMGTFSVLLFLIVLISYKKHMSQVAPDTTRELLTHMGTQRRVTRSMGISCVATFTFFILPRMANGIMAVLAERGNMMVFSLRLSSTLLYLVNPIFNLVIYYKRHENIRNGVKEMLKGKQLQQCNAALGVKANQENGDEKIHHF